VINLELKRRDADPAATEAACVALGAKPAGTLRQRDTYYRVASGKLKLREDLDAGTAELIAYERSDGDGVRTSIYERVPVAEPERLRGMLANALGELAVVEKRRRLFLYRHVRIHLDEVDAIGSFVELEAVQPANAAAPPERDAALEAVLAALGLDEAPAIEGDYLELVAEDTK
jgi:adenylate cyclase class IV